MACILKRVVGPARSVVVPAFRSASLQTNRRTFFSDGYGQRLKFRGLLWLLKHVPFTLLRMAKVTREGEVLLKVYGGMCQRLIVNEGSNVSLNLPGTAQTEETGEGLRVALDLELDNDKDFVPQKQKVELKKEINALFIQGYLQKQDIRRFYHARVNLPPTQLGEPINTEIKDGVLVVTIPKVVNYETPGLTA